MLTEEAERALVAQLRAEANDVKDCFTRYSFESIKMAPVLVGLLTYGVHEAPIVSVASIPIIVFLAAVRRMGAYKYATANRVYGYELHLMRTREIHYGNETVSRSAWHPKMREIGWEQAQRAWRVVQATVFARLFTVPLPRTTIRRWLRSMWLHAPARKDWYCWPRYVGKRLLAVIRYFLLGVSRNRLRRKYRKHTEQWRCTPTARAPYPWFLVPVLTERGGGKYHAGSYLERMLNVIWWMEFLAVLSFVYAAVLSAGQNPPSRFAIGIYALMGALALLGSLVSYRRVDTRRQMLEGGFLSIHSCAIIWQAVVLAHYHAIQRDTTGNYENYTQYLAEEAKQLRRRALDIHGWVTGRYGFPGIAVPASPSGPS